MTQVSIAFQSDKAPEEYVELARVAEAGGFDVVSVYHDMFFQPAIYPLLLMAQATSRVRLGPAALNPFTLHPVEIAGQIAALDAVSGGRAYLGLVRGSWLETETFVACPDAEERLIMRIDRLGTRTMRAEDLT